MAPDAAQSRQDTPPRGGGDASALLTSVPCNLLGKVLDHGRASIYAAHLLAIKTCSASGGKTRVLNEKHVLVHYGIGWRKFQSGMRLLRKTGVILDRKQTGRRSYAIETLAPASDNFVLIDQRLLKEGSPLVAFVLVVNLSPEPMTLAEVGARLGIKARATLRNLAEAAVERGAIARAIVGGATKVARGGTTFDRGAEVVKNGAAKVVRNGVIKNGATHIRWKNSTLDERTKIRPMSATSLPPAAGNGAVGDLTDEGEVDRMETVALREFETIIGIRGDEQPVKAQEAAVARHPQHVAMSEPALLGWLDEEDFGYNLAERADMLEADEDTVAELEELYPDAKLLRLLRQAAKGRVSRAIQTTAGLYALRYLAALVIGREEIGSPTPESAMAGILNAIKVRIGDRPGQHLNSVALIGKRIVAEIFTGLADVGVLYKPAADSG
jgi:hypothetical protein